MRLFKKLRRKLDYLDKKQIKRVYEAFQLALAAHEGQRRHSGEPYITHPVAVAEILAQMHMGAETVMAALLHDVIEDTEIKREAIAKQFGEAVADLVDGVSKLTQIEFKTRQEAQAENFRKMVMAMAHDIRVIIVKLADRLHNMRTLGPLRPDKRRRIARETLEIFAPVAKRLGMHDMSTELQDLGFAALYPSRYRVLKTAVTRVRGDQKRVLALIERAIKGALARSAFPECHISGREKHIYSIYKKMRAKRHLFSQIMDVYAFRIITDSTDTCYRVLGLIHSLYKPLPERFKDYIAIPKANGYQSLHTTLFGPQGIPVEVQIRTKEMDARANSGIAAHWLYKTGETGSNKSHLRAQRWVNNLLEIQKRAGNPLEFIESVKIDLFPGEVYVFTPKGRILELPMGATLVDFAYAVHTDIGHTCISAKVDRQVVPLSYQLMNGQTIEIITSPQARPQAAWLDFVVTGKARSSIRHYLKNQRRAEAIMLGQQLLGRALENFELTLKKVPKRNLQRIVKAAELETWDDILELIGLGERLPMVIARQLAGVEPVEQAALEGTERTAAPLILKGTEGMLVQFASCCYPIPGDPVVGIMGSGKGLMVHLDQCQRVDRSRKRAENIVPLAWAGTVEGYFKVAIDVEGLNQPGVLAKIAHAIADVGANIDDLQVRRRDDKYFADAIVLQVRNRVHLAQVLRSLRSLKSLIKAARVKPQT